jgi:hypothetical protein
MCLCMVPGPEEREDQQDFLERNKGETGLQSSAARKTELRSRGQMYSNVNAMVEGGAPRESNDRFLRSHRNLNQDEVSHRSGMEYGR